MTLRYRYRAATATGEVVEGVLDAQSRRTALDQLHRQRLYPVTVEEMSLGGAEGRGPRLGRRAAVAVWTRNAATLLGAGVPLERTLTFTADHAAHDGLATALRQVRRAVQEGSTLADALARQPAFFPPVVVAMVSAGEASGALDVVFERLSAHLEEAAELRSQVKSALLYPALMSVVATVGVLVLLVFVIPRFTAILRDVGGTLPLATQLLVGTSGVVTHWWWLWLAAALGIGYGVHAALRRPEVRLRWHGARLSWPWVGELERRYAAAAFVRTLGILLRSGVPMIPAIRIARAAVPNDALSARVERAAAQVSQGSALASALSGGLPPLALQMIAVGEESGRLEDMCFRIADMYDGEVRRAVRTLVALIEPAMILVFGGIVGFVALAMLQAIYSINATAF